MLSLNNGGCERKRISSMRSRLREHCQVGEARFGYVPSEQVATYRELMRLQHQLSDDMVRYKNEIHALLVVLFPEFTQVFVDPTRPTALAVLKRYPSAQAIAQTEVESRSRVLA
jgi:transposase